LFLGAQRPAPAHDSLVWKVICQENGVRPPAPERELPPADDGQGEYQKEKEERPDAQTAAEDEAAEMNRPGPRQLAPELFADEIAAEHKKQIDPQAAVLDERKAGKPTVYAAALEIGHGKMGAEHDQHCTGPQRVQSRHLACRAMGQVSEWLSDEAAPSCGKAFHGVQDLEFLAKNRLAPATLAAEKRTPRTRAREVRTA